MSDWEAFNALYPKDHMPTSDPRIDGVLWNDNGIVKLSKPLPTINLEAIFDDLNQLTDFLRVSPFPKPDPKVCRSIYDDFQISQES